MTDSGDPTVTETAVEHLRNDSGPTGVSPTGESSGPETVAPQSGDAIGRFIVIDVLGSGAMGIVVAAYDPKLDRKIALKLLRTRGHDREKSRTRLQREAQALAKLAHPNVVAVHDVGLHQGRVFLAMEHVDGVTLREWIDAGPHPREEILDKFIQAGKGLAAAHEAGLVHRDFKPDNVMVDRRGRVRVMDFGLARPDDAVTGEELDARRYRHDDALAERLTRTGALMGTPAYMAPEQWAGTGADASSDQFAFCVALYLGLYGERPFAGDTIAELALAATNGEVRPPKAGSSVPTSLRKIVLRGLEIDSSKRWPSMRALLEALQPAPPRTNRGLAMAGLAVVVVIGTVLAVANRDTRPEPCQDAARLLDGAWDDARKKTLAANFESSTRPYAEAVGTRVRVELDSYANDWVEHRTEACKATHVYGEQSETILDRRMRCLDRRLEQMRAVVEVLSDNGDGVVDRAIQAAGSLPALERCADIEALMEQIERPSDPAVLARLEEAERDLARADALVASGQLKEARPLADELVERSADIGYGPFRVEALRSRAKIEQWMAEPKAAGASQRELFFLAVELKDNDSAALAALSLAFIEGPSLANFDAAFDWLAHAEPHAKASNNPQRVAHVSSARGNILFNKGDYAGARTNLEQALEFFAANLDASEQFVTANHTNLGNVAFMQGQHEEAREHYVAAFEGNAARLGKDHPLLAGDELNLANIETELGHYAEARRLYHSALARRRASQEPDSPQIANIYNNLGRLAVLEDDMDEAGKQWREALRIRKATLPEGHWEIGISLANIGTVEQSAGNYEAARDLNRESYEVIEASLGAEHRHMGYPLLGLGKAEQGLGNHAAALKWMDEALATRLAAKADIDGISNNRFAIAELLWEAPKPVRDRERAHAEAAAALAGYIEIGANAKPRRERVEAWLEERGLSADAPAPPSVGSAD